MSQPADAAPVPHRHLGVYALIRHAGRSLLILKSRGPYTGLWDLPGGAPAHGEAPEQTLRREVLEETGLTVESARLLRVLSIAFEHTRPDGVREHLHHLGLLYEAQVDPAAPLRTTPDGHDAQAARWLPDAGLDPATLTPFARTALFPSAPHSEFASSEF